jgi:hypothetical protein
MAGNLRFGRLAAAVFAGRRLEGVVLALVALILTYQLFIEPIVGVADNRDYYRVMLQIGVDWTANPETTVFKNIQRKFAVVPRHDIEYLTSQVPLGRLAVGLNRIVSKDGLFDIRTMGFVNGLCYLAAVGIFLSAFRDRGHLARTLVAFFGVGLLTDVRLVSYFNSFFSESAQLVFLMATVGFALHALQQRGGVRAWGWYGAWLLSAVLFCVAKTQNVVEARKSNAYRWIKDPSGSGI